MGVDDGVEAMIAIQQLPQGSLVFAFNAHRQLTSSEPMGVAAALQAVANVREPYKGNFRMLVLMGPYGFTVPTELEQDVVVIEHALPNEQQLAVIVNDLYQAAKQPAPSTEAVSKAVEAVSGLSSFAAEQQAAMSFTDAGLDIPALWERKRITIEQTRGMHVYRGPEKFADIIGLDSVKARLRSRLKAKTPIGVVVWLDEIDKALANVEHDTSGVRMDQMRTLLTEMDMHEWRGLVAVGVSGGGKSLLAKAFGNEAGVPTIALDLGDMEGPHVGESEMMLRQAISVIKAVGRGHAYFLATSNNASVMRPELQRRFTDGMWFIDVPTDEERAACWSFYLTKYQIKAQPLPSDAGWTGAEIRNCARDAWDTGSSLLEASRYIVPMATSRANDVDDLRKYAHGRFLSASLPGTYRYDAAPMQKQLRAIALPPEALLAIADMKES